MLLVVLKFLGLLKMFVLLELLELLRLLEFLKLLRLLELLTFKASLEVVDRFLLVVRMLFNLYFSYFFIKSNQ